MTQQQVEALGKQLADSQHQINMLNIKDQVAKQTLQEIINTNIEIKTSMVVAQGQVNSLMQEKMQLTRQISDLMKENDRLNGVIASMDKAIGEKGKDTEVVPAPSDAAEATSSENVADEAPPANETQGTESDGA